MTLQQLNFFHQVVEEGSINQAASTLFVAQSSISNAIRDLEAELSIRIFIRHSKGMRLTREGQVLYDKVERILKEKNDIYDFFSFNIADKSKVLTISTLHFPFTAQAMVQLIHQLGDEKYDLRLKENNTQFIIDDVESRQSDIGVFFISRTTEDLIQTVLTERNLTFHPLVTTLPHVFLRKGHPLASRTELHANEFGDFPYLILDLEYSSSWESSLIKGQQLPKKAIHLTDRASIYNILRYTDAYSIGTGSLPPGYHDEEIISIPITRPIDKLQIGYIHPARKKPEPLVELFIEILKEKVKPLGDPVL